MGTDGTWMDAGMRRYLQQAKAVLVYCSIYPSKPRYLWLLYRYLGT